MQPGQSVPLQPLPRLEHLRRHRARRGCCTLGPVRPASQAAGRAGRRPAAGRPGAPASLRPRALLARARRLLTIRGALELDPRPIEDVASARPSSSPKLSAASAGSSPGASGTTFTSKPRLAASSMPRSVAACPAASASKHRYSRRVRRLSLCELPLGERGAHRRHDRLQACLAERDRVGVALDDDRPLLLRDRVLRKVQPVEHGGLVEEVTPPVS